MRRPNSGLPEFGIIIVQVGNSRPGCAGPESITPIRGYGFRARSLRSRPGMTADKIFRDFSRGNNPVTLTRRSSVLRECFELRALCVRMRHEAQTKRDHRRRVLNEMRSEEH